jgi:hypothetical protein
MAMRSSFLSGSAHRERIEKNGSTFRAVPGEANVDLNNLHDVAPELKTLEPGFDWLRVALEKIFIDKISDQHKGLLEALKEFPADAIIADDMFFGVVPMLLGSHRGDCRLSNLRSMPSPGFASLAACVPFLRPPTASDATLRQQEGAIR